MSASGRNVIVVPCSLVGSPRCIGPDRRAALVALRPHVAVAAHLGVKPLRQCVDDGHADAVQTAGNLVAATLAELAAGMEHSEHDLERRTCPPSPWSRPESQRHRRPPLRSCPGESSPRRCRYDRPAPHQQSCQQPRKRGGAARGGRSSRCTCRGACGPLPVPRVPGCSRRRSFAGLQGARRRLRSSTILRLTLRRPDRKKTARVPGRQSLVYRRIAHNGP